MIPKTGVYHEVSEDAERWHLDGEFHCEDGSAEVHADVRRGVDVDHEQIKEFNESESVNILDAN